MRDFSLSPRPPRTLSPPSGSLLNKHGYLAWRQEPARQSGVFGTFLVPGESSVSTTQIRSPDGGREAAAAGMFRSSGVEDLVELWRVRRTLAGVDFLEPTSV